MKRVLYPHSLRGRYLLVALGVALVVVVTAGFAYTRVHSAGLQSAANVEGRNRVVALNRTIRNAVWDAEHALHSYILSPTPELRREVMRSMETAREHAHKLAGVDVLGQREAHARLGELQHALRQLEAQTVRLMDLRTDTDRLFPGTAVMRDSMEPTLRDFLTRVQQHISTLEADDRMRSRQAIADLRRARYFMSMAVAEFRAFVAERSGAFGGSSAALGKHKRNVDQYYAATRSHLAALQRRVAADSLGFLGPEQVETLRGDARQWYALYGELTSGARSHAWRLDLPLLETRIAPLFSQIWDKLAALDLWVEQSAARDVSALNTVAGALNNTIALLTLVAVSLIVGGYFVFDRTVLRPIARVADALKSDATGAHDAPLPRVNSRETQQLVDAYQEMHNQVHFRQLALEHQALHDDLSGLPNRSLLHDRLDQAINAAKRDRGTVALLMMDLDRFKEINDTLGHQIGDVVLQQVGMRLLEVLRRSDTVARLGGDEFAMLLPGADAAHARQVATKLLTSLEHAFEVEGLSLYIGASIGIAIYPEHGDSAHLLMQRADVAMYVAKRANRDFSVYDVAQDEHSVRRLALVSDLRRAIAEDHLSLHYQPKLDLATGKIIGAEALLRWRHPEVGWVPPDQLVTVAEHAGLIRPLTSWVLREALGQCARWRWRGLDLRVAINLSVWNLQDPALRREVVDQLDDHGLEPERLMVEITENAMMAEPQRALDTVSELHRMGVQIAVDDYGTGFSSLAYLKRLPLQEIKIDKSFVIDMFSDENDAVIVRSTIDLAHNLGLRVVAEGVEDQDVLDLLSVLGCDMAQGFYIARPMPADAVHEWLKADPASGAQSVP